MSCAHETIYRQISNSQKSNEKINLDDEFKWLTERDSPAVRNWIQKQNDATENEIKNLPYYQKIKEKILTFSNSQNQPSYGIVLGKYYYDIFKNDKFPNGTLRRIELTDYLKRRTSWEILISSEWLNNNKNLFLKGFNCLQPESKICLLSFSINGADDVIVKEFNTQNKKFITSGFNIETPFKTHVRWKNENEIYVITKVTGSDVTESSYASTLRLWKRDTPLQQATEIMSVPKEHLGIFFNISTNYNSEHLSFYDSIDFKTSQFYSYYNQSVKPIHIPTSKRRGIYKSLAIFTLLEDASIQNQKFSKNETIGIDLKILHEKNQLSLITLYKTQGYSSIEEVEYSKNYMWVVEYSNLYNKITRIDPLQKQSNKTLNNFQSSILDIVSASQDNDSLIISSENLLSPSKFYYYNNEETHLIQESPEKFDSHNFTTEVLWTKSKDGTPIPYYLVHKKNMPYDASTPTLLYGYGAGNVITSPTYIGNRGFAWLETGGAYVHAILRGGGEFGADWRNQGMKEFKQNTFDDCIAILEDLIRRKVTRPELIGIYGSSWGGLLVASVMTQRPDLVHVVESNEPMLDMINYPLLPIGESWIGEFGSPRDPKFYEVLKKYSPYHNITPDKQYPTVLFTTSMNDDRMHPAHARRMVAKMQQQTSGKVFYYESMTGGHSGTGSNEHNAAMWALKFSFLRKYLEEKK